MIKPMPYFFTNKEWYYYDEISKRYQLTSKAPPKAIISHQKYYDEEELEESITKYFDDLYPSLEEYKILELL